MIIFSTYSLLYPLSRLKIDIVPMLPVGNDESQSSHAQVYCCFFKTFSNPKQQALS
jgi:hypothetical protein